MKRRLQMILSGVLLVGLTSLGAMDVLVQNNFSDTLPQIGDTIEFSVKLQWEVPEDSSTPLLFVTEGDLFPSGLELLKTDVQQKKILQEKKFFSKLVFRWRLLAQKSGDFFLPSITFRARNRGEDVVVKSLPKGLHVAQARDRHKLLLFLGGFLGSILAVLPVVFLRRKKRLALAAKKETRNWITELNQMELRLKTAPSKEWLLALAEILAQWLDENRGVSYVQLEKRLEDLKKELASEEEKSEIVADWQHLSNELRHALYGGGKRETHQNRNTLQVARRCLGVVEEKET